MFLPFTFLRFWYIEAPLEIIRFFASLNIYFMDMFALPLCIRTFFRPLKNEYREGLVRFSIAMGIFVKTILIAIDLAIFICLILLEFLVIISFLLFPLLTLSLLFIK